MFWCKKSISAFIEFTPSLKTNVMYSFCAKFNLCRVPSGQGKVREICCFFKVREKSGNSVKWSGKLENLRKSGNFKIMLCSTHQNLNKQIRDDDFDSF